MKEEWRQIEGYEGLYKVSDFGRVWSIRFRRALKPYFNGNSSSSHYVIQLNKGNTRKNVCLHTLVAKYFVPNPNNFTHVRFIDGNKHNIQADNLKWVKASGRPLKDPSKKYPKPPIRKESIMGASNPNSKITEEMARAIKADIESELLTYKQMSEKYGVSQPAISNIKTGRTWRHI